MIRRKWMLTLFGCNSSYVQLKSKYKKMSSVTIATLCAVAHVMFFFPLNVDLFVKYNKA